MEVARFWRFNGQRYQLIGEVCGNCGKKIFPPRDVCDECKTETETKRRDLMEYLGQYTTDVEEPLIREAEVK